MLENNHARQWPITFLAAGLTDAVGSPQGVGQRNTFLADWLRRSHFPGSLPD